MSCVEVDFYPLILKRHHSFPKEVIFGNIWKSCLTLSRNQTITLAWINISSHQDLLGIWKSNKMDCHSHWHKSYECVFKLWHKPVGYPPLIYVSYRWMTSHFLKEFKNVRIHAIMRALPVVCILCVPRPVSWHSVSTPPAPQLVPQPVSWPPVSTHLARSQLVPRPAILTQRGPALAPACILASSLYTHSAGPSSCPSLYPGLQYLLTQQGPSPNSWWTSLPSWRQLRAVPPPVDPTHRQRDHNEPGANLCTCQLVGNWNLLTHNN